MIAVSKLGVLISPTENAFENNGVCNPGVFQEGDIVHVLYRAVEKGNHSTIGYVRTDQTLKVLQRNPEPLISPSFEYEKRGVEDPRIVKIDDTYYVTYTAYDGINAPKLTYKAYFNLLGKVKDKLNPKYLQFYNLFKKIGLLNDDSHFVPDKDVTFFPRKIGGRFAMLHRLWPGIQVVYFDHWKDLTADFWADYIENLPRHILLDPKDLFEVNYIGAGGPPIETKDGWLMIYHGVQESIKGRVYHAKAALLNLDKPEKELARLNYPLFSPTAPWEKDGVVNYVVFPTGHALFGNDLHIYYGAADKHVAVCRLDINELLSELTSQIK
jgi:predicted GH43/DUF377 family glycosyl hydrolase